MSDNPGQPITKDVLLSMREQYVTSILQLQGAVQSIDELLKLFEPQALTLDDIKTMTGSKSVEVLKNEGEV